MQRRRCRAQQLLAQATKALAEAVSLCLQHKLPSSILAEASINMLDCHGQSEPAVAGQYLALFQVLCIRSSESFTVLIIQCMYNLGGGDYIIIIRFQLASHHCYTHVPCRNVHIVLYIV